MSDETQLQEESTHGTDNRYVEDKNLTGKQENSENMRNSSSEASVDQNTEKASNSCDMCRRLKKKCSKDLPACQRCVEKKISYNCFYPGKSRRRTKVEMERYRMAHPEKSVKRRKTFKKYEMKETTPEQPVQASSTNLRQNITEKENNGDFSPLSTINYDNRINPIQSMTSPITSNLYNTLLSASDYTKNNLIQFKEIKPVPYSNVPYNPDIKSLLFKKPPQITSQMPWSLENPANHAFPNVPSIPISAVSIQYETVKAIYKGGYPSQPNKKYHMTKELVTKAIMAYFRHNHRTYPMIDKIKFQERVFKINDYEELARVTDDDENEIFKFMVFFMLAIGSTTLHRAGALDEEFYGIEEYFSYLGMQRFQIVMKYQKMDTIRCLILLGVYSFFEPKGISSWTIGGIICRLCIGLGLNKQLTGKKKMSSTAYELELRNRCYWSTYCFEKLVHLSLLRGDGGLDVNDCNIPLPKPLYPEVEEEDIKVNNMMINLRILENKIFQSIHTIKAEKQCKNYTTEQRLKLISDLQKEVDETFQSYKKECKTVNNSPELATVNENGDVSFHRSELWLVMRYEQFQILLYRPSRVIRRLIPEMLTKLGSVCLSSLRHNYMLYQQKKMPFNWVTLFRALNVCNATCVCLYNWSIDLNDCEREFKQIIEVLNNFGPRWYAARNFAKVFKNISQSLLQFSLHVNHNNEDELQQLNFALFGPNSEYYDIMDENDVDISWLEFIK